MMNERLKQTASAQDIGIVDIFDITMSNKCYCSEMYDLAGSDLTDNALESFGIIEVRFIYPRNVGNVAGVWWFHQSVNFMSSTRECSRHIVAGEAVDTGNEDSAHCSILKSKGMTYLISANVSFNHHCAQRFKSGYGLPT